VGARFYDVGLVVCNFVNLLGNVDAVVLGDDEIPTGHVRPDWVEHNVQGHGLGFLLDQVVFVAHDCITHASGEEELPCTRRTHNVCVPHPR